MLPTLSSFNSHHPSLFPSHTQILLLHSFNRFFCLDTEYAVVNKADRKFLSIRSFHSSGEASKHIHYFYNLSFHLPFLLPEENFLPSVCLDISYSLFRNQLFSMTPKVDWNILSSSLRTIVSFQQSICFALVSRCVCILPRPHGVLHLMGQYIFFLLYLHDTQACANT